MTAQLQVHERPARPDSAPPSEGAALTGAGALAVCKNMVSRETVPISRLVSDFLPAGVGQCGEAVSP